MQIVNTFEYISNCHSKPTQASSRGMTAFSGLHPSILMSRDTCDSPSSHANAPLPHVCIVAALFGLLLFTSTSSTGSPYQCCTAAASVPKKVRGPPSTKLPQHPPSFVLRHTNLLRPRALTAPHSLPSDTACIQQPSPARLAPLHVTSLQRLRNKHDDVRQDAVQEGHWRCLRRCCCVRSCERVW
jgi:hypothetical protein